MSYSQIIRNAAAQSQTIIARMQGMADGVSKNFVYDGASGLGVFGAPQAMEEIPQMGGGYRRRVELTLTVTRTQSFNFEAKTKLVRLASANMPSITYVIDRIDTHDPLIWTIYLVKNGS